MEFINKGFFSSIIYFFVTLIGFYLFFNFLPVIFFIVIAFWGIYKVVNVFKNRKSKDIFHESSMDNGVEVIAKGKYDKTNAIDVDFTEINYHKSDKF